MQADTHAFIVRIWHEPLDDEGVQTTWRGSVQHVGSAKRAYFRAFDELVRFIREHAGIDGARPASESTAGLDAA